MDRKAMLITKRQLFWTIFLISAVLFVLCALYPASAVSILFNFGVPFFGALLILYWAWRAGKRPFGLLVLAILLALVSVFVERHAAGVVLSVMTTGVVDIALQVGALVSLVAALVIWIRG